jgi:hypothetical protein
MHDPPVAVPAVPLLIDLHDSLLMASQAILLENLSAVPGDRDPLGNPAGIEQGDILHAVDSFPDIVNARIAVGEMTVHAEIAAMSASCVGPGLVFGLHDMAFGTERRMFGLCKELRWAKEKKNEQKETAADSQQ